MGQKYMIVGSRKLKLSDVVSQDNHDKTTEEILKSKYGIKLIKSERGYMVVDKKRVRIFKSSTWALKKYDRLVSLVCVGRD